MGNLADVGQPGGIQLGRRLRADAGQPLVGERGEKSRFAPGRHKLKGGGLLHLGSNLADELVAADALAHGELERLPDGVANRFGDAQRRLARARQVEIALVNGADLHVRREVVGVGKHQPGEELVFIEVARQQNQPGTQPARQGGGHRRVDAELARLIRGRGNDAALFAAHGNGFAAQPRVRRLLDRGEKGVGIQVHNRAREGKRLHGLQRYRRSAAVME